ncbi:SusC/RagA family TonB-linked outer membrane protein [Robiginitalea sp. IMCC44478]|uniref:SusC/RagA family TonB-linked outer membrane protein n=1 Tax=Robiginitalea sp. IMCC44478 TaxID=3459122 RepID=UPI0040424025
MAILLLLTNWSLSAQQKTINGTVRDNFNEPLLGANVLVEGTQRGTITGPDGTYQIQAAEGETILFSYVGYITGSVIVDNRNTYNINLMPGNDLQEVVVVGYGTTSRKNLTDNIASISSEQIEEIPVPSLQGALVGKAAGVQISQVGGRAEGGFKIRVRGVATITGNQEPLYVIDGVPLYKNDFSTNGSPINDLIALNPADIESIEILKDASAAAIYGSRGTNGVVLINTKKGRQGRTRFSFNSSYGWSEPSNTREWLNTEEYVELYTEAALNSGFTEEDAAFFFNLFAEEEADWREGAVDTDWQSLGLGSGSVQDISFSASGGSEKTTFFLSTGYNKTEAILRGNVLERYSLRANIEHQANDWLTIGLNSNLSKSQLARIANDGQFANPIQAIAQIPFSRPYLEDGITPNTNTLYYNFLMNEFNAEHETNIWRAFAKFYGQIDFTDNLYLRSEFGYDITDQLEERFFGSLTESASTNGYADAYDDKEEKFVINNYLQYQLNKERLQLEATLGMSYEDLLIKGLRIEGQDFPSDQLRKLGSAGEITGGTSYEWRSTLVSYFARASATLFDSWLLKASMRVDGSSVFGANSQYGTFPAASVGWLASNEPFLQNSNTISNLKLRASWGITGNSNTNPFASRTQFNTNTYNLRPGFFLQRLGDSDLSWEETEQYNIGMDLGFFSDRVNTSIDYYDKYTKGLLFAVPIPATNGIRTVQQNLGEIQNKGLEWVLDTKNVVTENFSWGTNLNLAWNKNEVKALRNGDDVSGGTTIVREGEAVTSFYLVEYAGVDPANGDALYYLNTDLPDGSLDRSTTNNYNEASRKILGNPFPDVIAGMTHNLRYKGIDFSFTFQGQWGAQLYNGGGIYQSSNADFFDNQTRDQLGRWQQPGDITNIPQARLFGGNGSQVSSRYLEDADFIRLRNLTLGYTLPVDITQNLGMDRIRFYFTGVNLLTITDYTGWDPESIADFASGISANSGFVFYSPPQARTLTFGINVDF